MGLIDGTTLLRETHANDVSAAQWDLKCMPLEQLVKLRARTLDFVPGCSQGAHTAFLETLKEQLYLRLVQDNIHSDCPEDLPQGGKSNEQGYRTLGRRIALILGAIKLLRKKQPDSALPSWWAVGMEEQTWDGTKLVIVHTDTLAVTPFRGTAEQLATHAGEVCVIMDRSTASGPGCQLRWELAVVKTPQGFAELLERAELLHLSPQAIPQFLWENPVVAQLRQPEIFEGADAGEHVHTFCVSPEELRAARLAEAIELPPHRNVGARRNTITGFPGKNARFPG
eukprot:NODE_1886_length_1043_cov_220.599190.p1 GENE.NODE_1886_length_1043_cov_220.599190~~NODE_1886_length_1043_cov_220.599190.p1  ORF type:complete len:322 (-),score=86.18 NODE_1886_length_1043_cov_220.599190:59-907(-)